jgi:vacuolar-type H+-ATPase catalytic subunit A/Vma1
MSVRCYSIHDAYVTCDGTSLSSTLSTAPVSDLILSLLSLQDNLLEIVQLVGKESLSEDQKVSLCVQH